VAIELGPRLAEARGLEAIRELLLWVQDALAELDEGSPPVGQLPFAPILHAIEQRTSELRSQEATVFEAFGMMCRDHLGLDPHTLLRAHLGELHTAKLGLDQLEETTLDTGMLREWRELFARTWRELIG